MLGCYGHNTWPEQKEGRGCWSYCIRSQEAEKEELNSPSPFIQSRPPAHTHSQSLQWQSDNILTDLPRGKSPRSLQLLSNWQWSLTMWGKAATWSQRVRLRILQTIEILGELTLSGSQVRSAEDEIWAKGSNFLVEAMPLADQWGSALLLR